MYTELIITEDSPGELTLVPLTLSLVTRLSTTNPADRDQKV